MISNVVGYAGYKSYGDKPYSMFKPGQQSLERDYYSKATQEVADGKKNLENYQRFQQDYGRVSQAVKHGDYKVPLKDANLLVGYEMSHKPDLFQYTRRAANDQALASTFHNSAQ